MSVLLVLYWSSDSYGELPNRCMLCEVVQQAESMLYSSNIELQQKRVAQQCGWSYLFSDMPLCLHCANGGVAHGNV
jgi:hypothetical protein